MVTRRGQLLLTAAILVSVTIVASAVLLNNIHASADVRAQQERQSLEQTEREIEELQSSLEELFMVNGSSNRLPYVDDEDELANATEEYVQQYMNVSTKRNVQFVNVTLVDTKQNGEAIWQNVTDTLPNNPIITGNPSNLTYMSYTFEDISGSFTIEIGSVSPVLIEVDNGQVTVGGSTKCDGFTATSETPLTIEITHGTGQVSVGDSICSTVTLGSGYYSSNKHVSFENGDNVEGTFRIVTEDGTLAAGVAGEENVYTSSSVSINPTFRVTYQDPQVSYETNVTAYGGGS